MEYSEQDDKHNESYSIKNGAAATVTNSFISSFVPLFAISVLGANNQQIGFISSLPSLMTMFMMIPAAMWINKLQEKKVFTAAAISINRLLLFLLVFVPFLPGYQATVLVVIIGLMNIPGAVANLAWQSFIGDLIPDHRRGSFFGERNRVLTLVGMIVTFTTGIILNLFAKDSPFPYQVMFALGFLFGLLEVYFLLKHREQKKSSDSNVQVVKVRSMRLMTTHKPYLYFLSCAILFNFGWQMAWPLFSLYQINYAYATAFWISLFTVANQISQMITYKWWGRSADKRGNSVMLFVAAFGLALAPTLTVISTNLIYLTLINLVIGAFVAGTVMLLFNQLLHVSPKEHRTSFLANYNLLIAGVGFIAPQVGIFLLETFNIQVAMHVSSIIRILGAVSFLFVALYIEKSFKFPNRKLKKSLSA
ncbi:MFS transporter [Bacillus sp. HMF5848]|uniref:MFS transporter n=1 Tax=Bacillus sp. HMF5848 TaxID=2495421 RepID=UPI000F7A6F6A|nr:MFS transporter [Bacillus sp. HMF5848]RSK27385.1 MFS transporter [Bacillus sp. HMF5848]